MASISISYDLDGIKLSIIATFEPGEKRTRDNPGCGDRIDHVAICGSHCYLGGHKVEYTLPEAMVDEIRDKWDIDGLIYEAIDKERRRMKR
jgi:hypothetical protein